MPHHLSLPPFGTPTLQLQEREQQRLIEEELRDQETQALLEQMKRMQEEDLEKAKKKREENEKTMEEIAKVNEEAKRIKQQKLEAEQVEEQRVAEYLKVCFPFAADLCSGCACCLSHVSTHTPLPFGPAGEAAT